MDNPIARMFGKMQADREQKQKEKQPSSMTAGSGDYQQGTTPVRVTGTH